MKPVTFNSSFTRQFREPYMTYPCMEERRFNDIAIRQFRGSRKEMPVLASLLKAGSDAGNECRLLLARVDKTCFPAIEKTAAYTQKLQALFTRRAQQEPYTGAFYRVLLDLLQPLSTLINDYLDKALPAVLVSLKAVLAGDVDPHVSSSEHIGWRLQEMKQLEGELARYGELFAVIVQQEQHNGKASCTTSEAGDRLQKLVVLIDSFLAGQELLIAGLEQLHRDIVLAEWQEIYN